MPKNICPYLAYAPNLIDFGPLIDQISIFLNETLDETKA